MSWTAEIVRARFVEAADTERFLPAPKVGSGGGYWPEFIHNTEDREGWDDTARLENAARWKGRAPLGSITRHAECLEWTASLLPDDRYRKLIWAFSFCRANKWDFGKLCERKGWVKSTAYLRLDRTWQRLSLTFCKGNFLLRMPSDRWLGHETANMPEILITSQDRAIEFPKVPAAVIYERSRDLIRTQDDADNFGKFLQGHNQRARREQDRREARLLEQIEAA